MMLQPVTGTEGARQSGMVSDGQFFCIIGEVMADTSLSACHISPFQTWRGPGATSAVCKQMS